MPLLFCLGDNERNYAQTGVKNSTDCKNLTLTSYLACTEKAHFKLSRIWQGKGPMSLDVNRIQLYTN